MPKRPHGKLTFKSKKKLRLSKAPRRRSKAVFKKRRSGGMRGDGTVTRVGPKSERVFKTILTTMVIPPYGPSVLNITGPSWNQANQKVSFASFFDPTGTHKMVTGPQALTGTGDLFGTGTIDVLPTQQWAQVSALYGKYRVKKITCTFNALDNGDLNTGNPLVYARYVNNFGTVNVPIKLNPDFTNITRQAGWVRKKFDASSTRFQYSFYPKVMVLTDNASASITTNDTRIPKKMPWTPCTNPVELWGLQYMIVKPAADLSVIGMDIKYHCEFKEKI